MISCAHWGDPHLTTFDLYEKVGSNFNSVKTRNYDERGDWKVGEYIFPEFPFAGVYWMVYSEKVQIQGYYHKRGGYAVHGIAIGGPLLDGHKLSLEQMYDSYVLPKWDGEEFSSSLKNDWVTVRIELKSNGYLTSAIMQFNDDVTITISKKGYALVTVTMPSQPDGQDGTCGKADGDLSDDTTAFFEIESNRWKVADGESFFPESSLIQAKAATRHQIGASTHDGDVDDEVVGSCINSSSNAHLDLCGGVFEAANLSIPEAAPFVRSCAVDVCITGDESVAQDAISFFKSTRTFNAMLRWPEYPDLCIEVGGGQPLDGSGVQLWKCHPELASMQWQLPAPGIAGHIVWASNPDFCMNVQTSVDPPILQIWKCKDHDNMKFITPEAGNGKFRWAKDPSKCLDVYNGLHDYGTKIQLWDCEDEPPYNKLFESILPEYLE